MAHGDIKELPAPKEPGARVDVAVLEKVMHEAWIAYEKALTSFEAALNDIKISYSSQPNPGKALLPFFRKLAEGKEQTMEALERRDSARKQLEGVFQSLKKALDKPIEKISSPVNVAWVQDEKTNNYLN